MSYHIRSKNFNSYYFLGIDRITEVESHKDLGVLFDHGLTFKPQLEHLISVSTFMSSAAF